MSIQLIEANGFYDSKMDISEATATDFESAGVSPISPTLVDDEEEAEQQQQQHQRQNYISCNGKEYINHNLEESLNADHATGNILDNRFINDAASRDDLALGLNDSPAINMHSQRHIERKLANSHPLMLSSPHGTDSESDLSLASAAARPDCMPINKFRNYPDVIPSSEYQQTPQPTNSLPLSTSYIVAQSKNAAATANGKLVLPSIERNKAMRLRTHSPDLLSSESEADLSQYHATVDSNYQTVSLLPKLSNGAAAKSCSRNRKALQGREDICSLDSISNHSFDDDEDIEHNLASLSPSSSIIDGLDEDDDDDEGVEGPDLDDFGGSCTPTPALPQYTEDEERRDSRNWQKITLPDGSTREIDMRVIEPYKRVLSHGGYLQSGGHNAIVIFCACHLPDKSRADYNYVMDNLFLYVVKTLEQLVTEDYVLIYMHGGSSRRNVPPFPWLKRCYQLLDRRLRKSLKNMYLVHPTFWIKSLVWMTRPFVSTKFWRKLIYVKSLQELSTHVAVEKAAIPDKVKQFDERRK